MQMEGFCQGGKKIYFHKSTLKNKQLAHVAYAGGEYQMREEVLPKSWPI